ncbi:unnamed protein product [Acanthoscelides obtectus]|uniref:Uncharacterized protein n=1 Tax=Acanthoscelides obtectus TaxID=200917 RepID=A0A9P0LTY0_ACAOB|nr:unnamed protein product [Acanthoscelides obtectus]CAK1649457.1 hypothetical protein AOBTE_LOCUS16253 [Acanthoscelides obtectus]
MLRDFPIPLSKSQTITVRQSKIKAEHYPSAYNKQKRKSTTKIQSVGNQLLLLKRVQQMMTLLAQYNMHLKK